MKKIFLLCCAAVISTAISAQSVKLFKGKTEFATFSSAAVDRVAFDKETASAKLYKGAQLVKEYGEQTVDSVAFVKEIARPKLNITVGNYDDASTAAKTGMRKAAIKSLWKNGDIIKVWLDSNTSETSKNPNYYLQYTGSDDKDYDKNAWTTIDDATNYPTTSCTPQEKGTLKYIYYGDVVVAGSVDYTYEEGTTTTEGTTAEGEITAFLTDWKYLSEIQVVVRGFEADDPLKGKYSLACDQFTPITGFNVTETGIEAVYGNKGREALGIENEWTGSGDNKYPTAYAFVFGTADYTASSEKKQEYDFQIYKQTSVIGEYSPIAAIVENEVDGVKHKKIKNLTLKKSSFEEPETKYINLNGVKWGLMNVGATTVAGSMETCAGDYFTWSATEPWYTSLTYISDTSQQGDHSTAAGAYDKDNAGHYFTANGWKTYTFYKPGTTETIYDNQEFKYTWPESPYTDKKGGSIHVYKYNETDGKTVLDDCDDVAKVNWGQEWRMPETSDWNALAAACGLNAEAGKAYTQQYTTAVDPDNNTLPKGVYHCTNYDGVPGILFCDGINQVFFPSAGMFAAGKQFSNYSGMGYEGRYWTRSVNPDTNYTDDQKYYYGIVAIDFYYNSGVTAKGQLNDPTISKVARNTGRTVRGVRDDGATNKASNPFFAKTYNWSSDDTATATITKTGWEDGDQLKIWFDGNTGDTPDMVWTYATTTSDWTLDADSPSEYVKGLSDGATGYLKAVYQGKDLTVVGKSNYKYSISGETIDLDTYITNWTFLSEIQVAVKGLDIDKASSYTLSCAELTPTATSGYTVTETGATVATGTKGDAATGTSNGTDVIFTFQTTDDYNAEDCHVFTLNDGTSTTVYTAHDKTVNKNTKKVAEIVLKSEDFYITPAKLEYVDLGLPSGTLWATQNVGAQAPEDTGCHIAWGETKHETIDADDESGWGNYKWLDHTQPHSANNDGTLLTGKLT